MRNIPDREYPGNCKDERQKVLCVFCEVRRFAYVICLFVLLKTRILNY